MSMPPLTVRPIVHTDHLDEWLAVLRALGAHALTFDPLWTELQLDGGRVALTLPNRGSAEGEVSLGFETPDLDAFLAAAGGSQVVRIERFATADFESLRVDCRDGTDFLIDPSLPGPPPAHALRASVRAVWVTPDVEQAAQDLEALGLHRRPAATDRRLIVLQAAAGDVLVRAGDGGPSEAGVAVEVADLDAAHAALLDAGIAHDLIDEAQGRALDLPLPAGGAVRVRIGEQGRAPGRARKR